jgi:excisionase family DNA binding protein
VAEILGIKRTAVYEMLRRGVLPTTDMGSERKYIPRAAFERWLVERGMEPDGELAHIDTVEISKCLAEAQRALEKVEGLLP